MDTSRGSKVLVTTIYADQFAKLAELTQALSLPAAAQVRIALDFWFSHSRPLPLPPPDQKSA